MSRLWHTCMYTYLHTCGKWKVEQHSSWAESAIWWFQIPKRNIDTYVHMSCFPLQSLSSICFIFFSFRSQLAVAVGRSRAESGLYSLHTLSIDSLICWEESKDMEREHSLKCSLLMKNIAILLGGTLERDLWKKSVFGKSWLFGPIVRKKLKKMFTNNTKKCKCLFCIFGY